VKSLPVKVACWALIVFTIVGCATEDARTSSPMDSVAQDPVSVEHDRDVAMEELRVECAQAATTSDFNLLMWCGDNRHGVGDDRGAISDWRRAASVAHDRKSACKALLLISEVSTMPTKDLADADPALMESCRRDKSRCEAACSRDSCHTTSSGTVVQISSDMSSGHHRATTDCRVVQDEECVEACHRKYP